MNIIATTLRSLFIVVLVSLTTLATTTAFVITTKSSSGVWSKQQFVDTATTAAESKADKVILFGRRQCNDINNEITNERNDDKLMWMNQQVKKCMTTMAAIITIGGVFTSQASLVSATSYDPYRMHDVLSERTSLLLAKGAYVPEAGYDALDFSMPTYRVDEVETTPININDIFSGSSDNDSAATGSKKKASSSSSSSPNRAEKGAQAVAQAKAKKEAAKAEALANRKSLKDRSSVQTDVATQ